MYKITDFTSEIGRKTIALFQNHLFLLFFIVFIVFIGTFGIWVTPLLLCCSDEELGCSEYKTSFWVLFSRIPLLPELFIY